MKHEIKELLQLAIDALKAKQQLPADLLVEPQIDRTKDKNHGDFACNIAMILARQAKRDPRSLAKAILEHLPAHTGVKKVTIAGPGFINFFLSETALSRCIEQVLAEGNRFGRSNTGNGEKIHIEYVSANPTGPLHVGHGRSAAYGAALADLLEAVGYQVHREYYVNDAGRQMDILATSIWLRYLESCQEQFTFPQNAYKGDYVIALAKTLQSEHGQRFLKNALEVFAGIAPDEGVPGGDKEKHIDDLIARAKELLGEQDYAIVFAAGLNSILEDIAQDLAEFGVTYQEWFSEKSLVRSGAVARAVEKLKASQHTYEKDGAIWFNSTAFGDDKDRVLVRDNGQATYFASDVAYHMNKYERGFDQAIDILGADHHGYVTRVKASIKAMGGNPDKLTVLLVQFATLFRGKERVQMSTRSGSFVTLRELREEVGNDAARFFYVMRKSDHHMDFDLELAKSQSTDNPVYYIQYAHARIASVLRQIAEKNVIWDKAQGLLHTALLTETHETALIGEISRYPELIQNAALQFEPHQIAHYLRDLANHFHTYYNAHQFIVNDDNLRNARLCLIAATQQVLHNGLTLLGVSAPEQM